LYSETSSVTARFFDGKTPAAPTVARAESFTAAARGATIGAGIFSALVHQLERAQSQAQFPYFFFISPFGALATASQPRPVKQDVARFSDGYDFELLDAAAAELLLHLGAFHQRHAAHFHGAPDHARRVTPLLPSNSPVGAPLFN
jgi:hypothetical protein